MVVKAAHFAVFWLNDALPMRGLSSIISPRALVMGREVDYRKHCRIPFGTYAQVNDKPSPSNSMTLRTSRSIALGLGANLQGGYKFLSLRTGQALNRRAFTKLPVPRDTVERVKEMAEGGGGLGPLTFGDRTRARKTSTWTTRRAL
eukprot:1645334-Ditylum_brightwellii.AAC.1